MNNERVISSKQVSRLLLAYVLGASVLIIPNGMARTFGPAAWIVALAVGIIFTAGGWLTAKLAEKYPDQTIVEFGPELLGKVLGFIFNLGLSLFFLSMVPYQIRAMVELVNIAIIPNGPAWFISLLFIFTVVYGVIKGLDTFVQLNEILIGIALVIGIAVVLVGWQNMNTIHLLPVFYHRDIHLKNFSGIFSIALAYFGYPLLFYVAPFLKKPHQIAGHTVRTLLIVSLIYGFLVLTVIGVFGVKETGSQGWPVLELAKSIKFPGAIFERMDLVILVSWIPAIYTTAASSLFFATEGLRRIFHLKRTSFLIWGLAVVFYFVSGRISNYFEWNRWGSVLAIGGLFLSFALPLLLWFAYLLRPDKRGAKSGNGETDHE